MVEQADRLEGRAAARVQRQHEVELVRDAVERGHQSRSAASAVVDVGRAGAGSRRRTGPRGRASSRAARRVVPVEVGEQRVDHRVADEVDACRRRGPRWRGVRQRPGYVTKQQVGELVGEPSVDLLGHRHVEAAQAGLDVSDGDARAWPRRARRRRSSSRRRRRRPASGRRSRNSSSRPTMIAAVCAACVPEPTLEVDVRLGQAELRGRRRRTSARRSADRCGRAAARRPACRGRR